jgi:hypothetical protein
VTKEIENEKEIINNQLSDNVTIFKGADREIQNGTAKVRSFIDDLSQNNILGAPKFDEQLSSAYLLR